MSEWNLRSRRPIGVIGTGQAIPGDLQYETACDVGRALAARGLAVVCGGRRGVMEAVSLGASEQGGLVIGILPKINDPKTNPYATLLLDTDLGTQLDRICGPVPDVSRNRVIASSGQILIAIGGGAGTANEIAHGLRFGKSILGLAESPDPEVMSDKDARPITGTYTHCQTIDIAMAVVDQIISKANETNMGTKT